jgi:hypothetical protein
MMTDINQSIIDDAIEAGFSDWNVNIREKGIHIGGKDITLMLEKFAELTLKRNACEHVAAVNAYKEALEQKECDEKTTT